MFSWNSLAFSMIQQMLAIWSLVPLPFLKPAWTSGSSRFTYCWSLALENFEHYFTSVWDECNCVVVWAFFGEGNGTPLQYSCLENPRDSRAWWAAVSGVAQSWTWLKRLSSSRSSKKSDNTSVEGNVYQLKETIFNFSNKFWNYALSCKHPNSYKNSLLEKLLHTYKENNWEQWNHLKCLLVGEW